jgi:hypothetical protein
MGMYCTRRHSHTILVIQRQSGDTTDVISH